MIVKCVHCLTHVMPTKSGHCPACRLSIENRADISCAAGTDDVPDAPLVEMNAPERQKSPSASTSESPAEVTSPEVPLDADSRRDYSREFELAWSRGIPDINDFLPDDQRDKAERSRHSVLIALIERDLRARWCPGLLPWTSPQDLSGLTLPERRPLEDYIRGYPELGTLAELPIQLVVAEFRARLDAGDSPQLKEYLGGDPARDETIVDALLPLLQQKRVRPVLCNGMLAVLGRSLQSLFFIGFLGGLFKSSFAGPGNATPATYYFAVSGIGSLIVALMALGKFHPHDVRKIIAWRWPSLLHTIISIALPIPCFFLACSVSAVRLTVWDALSVSAIDWSFHEKAYIELAGEPFWLMLLIGCLLPALAEEIFFRAFVGRGLIKAYGVTAGVLLTSLIFGLFHVRPGHVVFAFVFGIVLHFLYLMTKSLFAPMLLHALNNLLAFTEIRWEQSGFFNPTQDGSVYIPVDVLLISLLTFSLLLFLLGKTRCRWMVAGIRPWTPGFVSAEMPPALIPASAMTTESPRRLKLFAAISFTGVVLLSGMTIIRWLGLTCANLALQQIDAGKSEEADESSQLALSWAPELAWCHAARGWVLAQKRDFPRALECCARANEIDPALGYTHTVLGWIGYLTEKYNRSIDDCDTAIRLNHQDSFAYAVRGAANFCLDEFEVAIRDSSRAIGIQIDSPLAYAIRGASRVERGQLDAAMKDLSRAIELDSTDPFSWSWRSRIKYERDDFAGAIEDSRKALTIDSENVISHYYLGNSLEATQDIAGAIESLSRYLELVEDDTVLLTRARLLHQSGNTSLAVADLDALISRYSEDEKLYVLRVQAYHTLGQHDAAARDERKIDQIRSAEQVQEIWSLINAGRYDQATNQVAEALLRWPDFAELHAARAAVHWHLQEFDAGIADYTTALNIDPNNAGFLEDRGNLYRQLKDYPSAISDLSRAIQCQPTRSSAYRSRGQAYLENGQQTNADADFSTATSLDMVQRTDHAE